ncbi:hypothetical protein ACTPOK_01940 [Streptomyces inhibens]|uniref:hypothetical protein n=1 Tax=Streptomyces inhibens TaxID=2293571 RepID=UPI00402A88DE
MSTVLPSLDEQNAREHAVYRQVENHIFETEIKPRVRPEIIEEHRRHPIGKHSDDLERVLTYLRRHHLEMTGKYILVCTKPHEEWRIAVIRDDVPPQLLDEAFPDRYEAEHALFLKRLRGAGLLTE